MNQKQNIRTIHLAQVKYLFVMATGTFVHVYHYDMASGEIHGTKEVF
ncbi:MAG: hypothetical protein ACE5D7_10380 [Fidelibacterota bacterium]